MREKEALQRSGKRIFEESSIRELANNPTQAETGLE
jgi:hypothetical protein